MATLKELKLRIASVQSTRKITRAKQMVAAAKLRRAQAAAEAARPYAERLEAVVADVAARVAGSHSAPRLLAGTGQSETHLLVVAAADRGLAGAFNANIIKAARARQKALVAQGKTVKLLVIGKKARAAFLHTDTNAIVDYYDTTVVRTLGFEQAEDIANRVLRLFDEGAFDIATLFYSRFQSVLAQIPTEQQLIPVALPVSGPAPSGAVVEYEPGEEQILTELLPRNLRIQVFKALLENAASEQGASMTAMDNATRNAGELIDQLTIEYNRSRQAAITKELIEIISGAEAL